jgi:hypothetical protein
MEKEAQGNGLKKFLVVLLVTPIIVLPVVLLLMRKKKFVTAISASSLKKESGTNLSAGVLAGVAVRQSWFSGYNATVVYLFQDGSVVVTQGQGTLIAGAQIPYWWGVKNYIWENISARWNKSLGVGPQNQGNVSLAKYKYSVPAYELVFIAEGSTLGTNLPDPFQVRASVGVAK